MLDIILLGIVGLMGVFMIATAISAPRRWFNLRQNGVTVEGRITDCYIYEGSEDTIYSVTYSYKYDGKAYWIKQSVSGRHYKALKVSEAIITQTRRTPACDNCSSLAVIPPNRDIPVANIHFSYYCYCCLDC